MKHSTKVPYICTLFEWNLFISPQALWAFNWVRQDFMPCFSVNHDPFVAPSARASLKCDSFEIEIVPIVNYAAFACHGAECYANKRTIHHEWITKVSLV